MLETCFESMIGFNVVKYFYSLLLYLVENCNNKNNPKNRKLCTSQIKDKCHELVLRKLNHCKIIAQCLQHPNQEGPKPTFLI